MKELKMLEVRRVDIVSIFRFFGGTFLLIGLVIGLFGSIFRIDIVSLEIARVFPFMARIRPGIFAGIVFGILYGLSAALGLSIFALLYNFFAALFGGLKVEIKD